jgi:hypothetical protein
MSYQDVDRLLNEYDSATVRLLHASDAIAAAAPLERQRFRGIEGPSLR